MAAPTPATPKPLTISPATADVNANAACRFTVDPPGTEVTWAIQPAIGKIDGNGIYKSPEEIIMPQTVVVTATAASGQSGVAVIDLTDAPVKINWLGLYAVVVGVVIAISILVLWNQLYQPSVSPVVIVSPSVVTLDAAKDEAFSFAATIAGDSKNAVTWTVDKGGEIDSTGLFRRKKDAKDDNTVLTITARSVADPARTGTATLHLLSGKHLEVAPKIFSVLPSQQIPFRTPGADAVWSVNRTDIASISPDGFFTAGFPGKTPVLVQVTAWGATAHEQAAAALLITPMIGSTDFGNWRLMLFVMMCGALGSMVYYASSFVGYVGNRTFRSSWFWFYVSRPFVGGALAVIFFFVLGSGLISGTSGGELMRAGMISALVGLFSDKAVKKLSDILDVLLATKDDRKDKVTETKDTAATAPAAPSTAPKIGLVKPATLSPNQDASVAVQGANLKSSGFKLLVNGVEVTPTNHTETGFQVAITAAQTKEAVVKLIVTTDKGEDSFELPVKA